MRKNSLVSIAALLTVLVVASCAEPTDNGDDGDGGHDGDGGVAPKLVVTERSASTLKLQWDAFGTSGWYYVDVLLNQPSCASFPEHFATGSDVNATSMELTQLTPSTIYHIHVHPLDGPHGHIPDGSKKSTNAYVSTLAVGAGPTPVVAGDYQVCN